MSKISNAFYSYLDKLDITDRQTIKKRTLILAMGIMATTILIVLACIYLFIGYPPMVLCTILGALACIFCCMLDKKGMYNMAGLFMTGGIVLVIIADDYFVGNSNNSILYMFTVFVVTILIPYSHRFISVILWITLPILATVLFIVGDIHTPPHPLDESIMHIFAIINIFVTSSGIILLVGLFRLINHYVDNYSQKKLEALQDKSYRDALTKMYNRHYADLYFEKLKKESMTKDLCIAIADLDNFKKVNDTYGHDVGDTTLCQISSLIQNSLRRSDIVVRWGGEEFVIILHDVLPDDAHVVLDKIRNSVEKHTVTHDDIMFSVTVTIGLAKLDLTDVDSSVKACDEKLYEGKQGTKNIVVM